MGGGDLNLKKSWHPHTMKNQEKVWKAEQAKNAEDRKMNDLRREIMEEKNREDLVKIGQSSGVLAKNDDKKLEWMYKSSSELINREDYLLGRPIDKAFENLEAEEKSKDISGMKMPINHVEHECIPFSIRSYRNAASTEQVDLQRKMLEDPLMMIKQKEMESRRKILENPVKLKELHRILKSERMKNAKSNEENSSKKNKKSKKSKKKKHRRSDSDEGDESDKDLDEMLQRQYRKLKDKDSKQLAGLDLSKLLDAKYETISKELDKAAQSKKKKGKSKKSAKNRSSSSTGEDSNNNDSDDRHTKSDHKRPNNRERSRSPYGRRDQQRDRERHSPSERRNWSGGDRYKNHSSHDRTNSRLQKRSRSRSPQRGHQYYRRSRSPAKSKYSSQQSSTAQNNRNESKPKAPTQKQRLTDEEKEKRLKDMMENAAWRDKERTRNVQKYREGYKKEEEQNKAKDFDKEFINKQLRKAISTQNSVESRIKSNVNNIQRTSAAMNANFAKK